MKLLGFPNSCRMCMAETMHANICPLVDIIAMDDREVTRVMLLHASFRNNFWKVSMDWLSALALRKNASMNLVRLALTCIMALYIIIIFLLYRVILICTMLHYAIL